MKKTVEKLSIEPDFNKDLSLKDTISDDIIRDIVEKQNLKKADKIHTDGPWVYFIMAGKEKWSPIKIGFTENIIKRFDQIRVGTHANVNLIAAITGDRSCEKSLHDKFKKDRIKGEWFRQTHDLLVEIDLLYRKKIRSVSSVNFINEDTFIIDDDQSMTVEDITYTINEKFSKDFSKKYISQMAKGLGFSFIRIGTKRGFKGIGKK